jgi:hypothetical protein
MTKNSGFKNNFGGDATYADVSLSASDRDAFLNWMGGVLDDLEVWLTNIIADSYRVSLKIDYNNSCAMCTLTQQDSKHINHGLIISSRADDWVEAFWLCAYKIAVLFEGQRLPTRDENNRWG